MPDRDLIVQLKAEFDVRTTSALADRLGIPLATLAKAERGEGRLPWKARLIILDKLGFAAARRGVESLLPNRFAQRMRDASNRLFIQGISDVEVGQKLARESLPEKSCSSSLFALLQEINRSDLKQQLDSFLELVTKKHGKCEPENLDSTDRAKLVETLYKLDSERWGSLVSQLTDCLSSDAQMCASIEEILNQNRDDAIGKTVIEFIAEAKGTKSDKELCAVLGITPSKLSRIRNGKTNIAPEVAVFADFLGSSSDISSNEKEFRELDRLVSDPDLILNEVLNK